MVYLGLGTNLGDRPRNLRAALDRLARWVKVTAVSRVYETEPWGIREQPRFLNMAVAGETSLAPEELLRELKRIEREMGRTEGVRYGPRVIDIDILLYGDLQLDRGGLKIPHPRLAERRFVLAPLAEIAPALIPPGMNLTVQELLERLPDEEQVELFRDELSSS